MKNLDREILMEDEEGKLTKLNVFTITFYCIKLLLILNQQVLTLIDYSYKSHNISIGYIQQVKLGCLEPKINRCPYSLTSRECEEFDEYQCNPCLKSYHKKSGGKE